MTPELQSAIDKVFKDETFTEKECDAITLRVLNECRREHLQDKIVIIATLVLMPITSAFVTSVDGWSLGAPALVLWFGWFVYRSFRPMIACKLFDRRYKL